VFGHGNRRIAASLLLRLGVDAGDFVQVDARLV